MDVRQLMSSQVITVPETATCHDAVERMVAHRVRHLPVVTADGSLCGIVTDRDLRHYLFRPEVMTLVGRAPVDGLLSSVPVREIMSKPVVFVAPDAPVEQAARLMLEDKLGSLPVVEQGGRLVGIVTETDLLRRIVGEDACCGAVETIVVSFP